jgi:hypothetical protein
MDEGRKRVVLIAAAILAARKLSTFEGGKRVSATLTAISDAVRWAEGRPAVVWLRQLANNSVGKRRYAVPSIGA